MLHTFFSNERGQGLVEYVIVLTSIVLAVTGITTLLNKTASLTTFFATAWHQHVLAYGIGALVLLTLVCGVRILYTEATMRARIVRA